MRRTIQPEILDGLAPDHPDARHSRRDLRLTNALAGSHRWIARTLPPLLRPGERALELGAGTGELGARLAAAGVAIDGLDTCPQPAGWPSDRTWHRADLRAFDGYATYAAIVGNLIFHHFTAGELAALGEKIRRHARVIIACEPARVRRAQTLFRLIAPLFGANHVTRHDAHVSIAAGFRGDELPRALGLAAPAWEVRCSTTLLGLHRMIALRRA
ncbi:MAG: hypothetical protein JNK23_07635 [Opitutaceae bacterium]|nr:hypothetical protein [Opitutaceae bacterium]